LMLAVQKETRPPTPTSGKFQRETEQTVISKICSVM
jgi:hypothetical protein